MTPFDRNYVIKMTVASIRKSIEFSVRRTLSRNIEFEGEPEKQREIVETLQCLQVFHKLMDEYEDANPELFK